MKHKTGLLIGLSVMSIVLFISGVGAYFILFKKQEPTKPHIRLNQTMNLEIYYPDWKFQDGKVMELKDKVTLENVEEKEFTQKESLNNSVTRNQFVYTLKHELDTKGNKVEKDLYYQIISRVDFGITKEGYIVKNSEAMNEPRKEGDVYYTYSTFLVPVEQICFKTQVDKYDIEERDVQCMKTGTEQSHKGAFPYSYKQGEVGKPVTLKQGENEFTMTLTKVIRSEEFDESFFIFEVDPKENTQIYFENLYYGLCSNTEICQAKSRTPEEKQKYTEYYQKLLEQEKAEVPDGGKLESFDRNQPKRFSLSTAGSKSEKFTFGFSSKIDANNNVYWELG